MPPTRSASSNQPELQASGRTHKGLVRSENQDRLICDPERGLFAVIDGMGGQRDGSLAAEVAQRAIEESMSRGSDPAAALREANQAVFLRGAAIGKVGQMGCVATVAQVSGDGYVRVAHVGDTRAYLASAVGCAQVTRDHTVTAEIEEASALTEHRTASLPGRNVVTRDLGAREEIDGWIESSEATLGEGDLLLLCSDGLHGHFGASELMGELQSAFEDSESAKGLVDRLIETCLERGAKDNVTVVAVVGGEAGTVGSAAEPAAHGERQDTIVVPEASPSGASEHPESSVGTEAASSPETLGRGAASVRARARPSWLLPVGLSTIVGVLAFLGGRLSIEGFRTDGPVGAAGRIEESSSAIDPGGLFRGEPATVSFSWPRSISAERPGLLRLHGPVATTALAPGVEGTIADLEIETEGTSFVWHIALGPGSVLRLERLVLARRAAVVVTLESDESRLEIRESDLGIRVLIAEGAPGSRVLVDSRSRAGWSAQPWLRGATLEHMREPVAAAGSAKE